LAKGTLKPIKKSSTENIKISTASIVETKKKKTKCIRNRKIKIVVLNLKESYPTNKSHTLIIEIENGEKTVLLI
jgi:hypothetical protein